LMKFDASRLIDSAAFLGPFSFSLFILIMVFVCLSMFLTIIYDSFHRAQEDMDKTRPDTFSLMCTKFLYRTGYTTRLNDQHVLYSNVVFFRPEKSECS
jgi:hypothetical protein